MPPNAVEVEQVTKRFGETLALDHVDLGAETGKVLGLLGPNGAGKTTLIRVLSTLLRPDSGRALVEGHDVVEAPATVRSLIGLAGQYAAVDELLTGRENLELVGLWYHLDRREYKRRAAQALERFGLGSAGDRLVKGYSGGMRRRLDVAASLVGEPPVVFLDEPTTGLDPKTRNDLWSYIEELVDHGTTVLLTTQYMEEAERLRASRRCPRRRSGHRDRLRPAIEESVGRRRHRGARFPLRRPRSCRDAFHFARPNGVAHRC